MKFQSVASAILFALFQFVISINGQSQCDNPLELDWVKSATNSSCTDTIYSFTYENETYIYLTRKESCIDADWSNELYNCQTKKSCYVFGRTLPEDQCDEDLLQKIYPFLTKEYTIFPLQLNCKPLPYFQAAKGDVFIDDPCYGVILTAPNGICFRLTVKSDGDLSTLPVRCPQ